VSEIWCDDEKIGVWGGASDPEVGDRLPVTIDGEKYNAKVKKVYKQHNENCPPTTIIEIENPKPMPIVI